MKLSTKQLTLCAVLTAMALALSYLENFFPLSLAIPIPGIKLGLANNNTTGYLIISIQSSSFQKHRYDTSCFHRRTRCL